MPGELISEALKEQISQLKAPNIAVIGRVGVGKSTIINEVFEENLAEVGAVLPVTQGFRRYPDEGSDNGMPIVVYDSAGYEAGKEAEFVKNVSDFIHQKQEEGQREGVDKQIHLIWYVINASSARVENFEKDIINQINKQGIPAIIILSQCDRAKPEEIEGIKAAIDKFELNKVFDVIEVAASPLIIHGQPITPKFGLDKLVSKTIELVPEIYTDAVLTLQKVNIKAKRKVVWKYISPAATTCLVMGGTPANTAPILIASQTGLCIAIASVYGYKEIGEYLVSIGTVTALNTFLNAAIGDLLAMFLPAGGLIAAVNSSSHIVVFGLACTAVFEQLAQHKIDNDRENIEDYLKVHFRKEFDKFSLVRISSLQDLEILKRNFLDPP